MENIPALSKKRTLKVVVIGESSVGKTSIMQRFLTGEFDLTYRATIGADFSSINIKYKEKLYCLQIWDTAG